MHEILPWVENLITSTILTTTLLASDANPGDIVIQVEDINWFQSGGEIAIGNEIRCISSIDSDSHLITLTDHLDDGCATGSSVQKLRAVDPPLIYIGDYNGPFNNLPIIQIKGASQRIDPLTIGANANVQAVEITILAEQDSHSRSYQDMLALTNEIRFVLLCHRQFWMGCRWVYNAEVDTQIGTKQHDSVTLAASQLTWTFFEEFYVVNVASEPGGNEIPLMPTQAQSLICDTVVNVDMLYYIDAGDCSIFCNTSEFGAFNVYLPQATITKDHPFLIKKSDDSANAITILPWGDDKIESEDSYTLSDPGETVILVYRGNAARVLPPVPNWESIEQPIGYQAVSF